jgi:hypothetical protein
MSTIKITELTNIGANLAYTTLVPVVNMSGTPETQKANLQIVGNLILSGAGGSYFAAAAQANLAQTVSNAAQPNITSLGTLTSVTVSGNANVGNIGATQGVFTSVSGSLVTASQPNVTSLGTLNALNVNGVANLGQVANVKILGGTTGQILSTDGTGNLSWTNDTTTYGNSNVGAYLANYTGNIAQVNVGTSANLGTVANITILGGTAGQILSTDGAGNLSWTNDTTTYGNSNVGAYLANYVGNIGNLGFSQSNQSVILGSGVSYVRLDSGNTRIADDSSNVEIWSNSNIFKFTTTGNLVVPNNISATNIGNVAAVNLDGNVSNVLRGNGTFGTFTGVQGIQGLQGIQGTQGLQGVQGLTGLQGLSGLQGVQGTQGLQGVQGTIGTQGLSGLQGITGTGTQGVQGVQGIDGLQGLQGITGAGVQGLQGITGTVGTSLTSNLDANTYSISNVGNIGVTGNITGNTNGFAIGYLNIPQVSASNTTIGLTDAGKHYYSTTAGNITLTIPNNSTTSFATGTALSIVVQAAGNVLVNADAGVTLYLAGNSTAGNRVVSTYGMATLLKVASDTWFMNGTGVS